MNESVIDHEVEFDFSGTVVHHAQVPRARAYVLVIVPSENGRMPENEANYSITDPLYSCAETTHCNCRVDLLSRQWRVECLLPGRAFDRRVDESFSGSEHTEDTDEWTRNIRPVSSFVGPVSAYAIVTPEGIWLETPEPEHRDIFVERAGDPVGPRELSAAQVAWRSLIADVLKKYPDHWVLGCDASLNFEPTRNCAVQSE